MWFSWVPARAAAACGAAQGLLPTRHGRRGGRSPLRRRAAALAGAKEKRAASSWMRPAACCDSDGIQTRNLLIRSQMLYSVELRSQRFVCASSLNCGAKVVSFLQTAKLFGENFHAKGKKVGFGAHRSPLRGIHGCHPGLAAPAAAVGGLSLRTAKAGSNLPGSRTESE